MAKLLELGEEGFGILSGDILHIVEYDLYDDGMLFGSLAYHGQRLGFSMCSTHHYRKMMRQARFSPDPPEMKIAKGILKLIEELESETQHDWQGALPGDVRPDSSWSSGERTHFRQTTLPRYRGGGENGGDDLQ